MLKIGILGCGYWADFQIAAWLEVGGVEIVALYNRTLAKAQALADKYGIPLVYDDAALMLDTESLDAVDIITDVFTHEQFTIMAAERGIPVICQKPMAPDLDAARRMIVVSEEHDVPLYIHENWRWQPQIREYKRIVDSGVIGRPFRARITYCNSYPVFDNQPFLADLDQFILTDIGTHILDVARYLFGEAESVYCQTYKVHQHIKGEDMASVALKMESGLHCNVELSYASLVEHDRFPETYILIEGDQGSIELGPDYVIKTTTEQGTLSKRVDIPQYNWSETIVMTSMPNIHANFLSEFTGIGKVETTGEDNLKTLEIVYACYDSAKENKVIEL